MKKLLTFLVTAVLTLCASFSLVACGGDGTINPREETIVVGYTNYAPMNYTEDGVFKGFDTELAIMTFEALGYNVQFKLIEWSNKYIELNGETIDCIWNGFTSNGEDNGIPRAESVDFTYNYMQNAQCIIRMDTTAAVNSYADFDGKSISFESGSAGQSLITDNTSENAIKYGRVSQMDAVLDVKLGMADYAVVDVLLAQSVVNTSDYAGIVIDNGIQIPIEYYAVGFKKGSPLTAKVNKMFETFAELGYLNTLATKYNLATSVITNFN